MLYVTPLRLSMTVNDSLVMYSFYVDVGFRKFVLFSAGEYGKTLWIWTYITLNHEKSKNLLDIKNKRREHSLRKDWCLITNLADTSPWTLGTRNFNQVFKHFRFVESIYLRTDFTETILVCSFVENS